MSVLLYSSPVLAVVAALGLETVQRHRDRRRFPPPGRMVDVGGHRLHARMLGKGNPVIVLEADSAAWSASWDRLPERLSEQSTVIAYDRAGLGWSEPGPGPRTPATLARELHALLRQLAPGRPVVLVAHGGGARVASSFTARYPFQVSGLVAVDGEHESLEVELGAAPFDAPTVGRNGLRVLDWAGRLGLLRLLGFTPALPDVLPESTQIVARTLAPRGLGTVLAEERDARAEAASPSALEVPVRVLVAQHSLPREGTPAGYPRDDYNRLWARASARFATVSSCSEVRSVEDDHFFYARRPQLVEEAVREVLATANP